MQAVQAIPAATRRPLAASAVAEGVVLTTSRTCEGAHGLTQLSASQQTLLTRVATASLASALTITISSRRQSRSRAARGRSSNAVWRRATTTSSTVAGLSQQARAARQQMEENEELRLTMQGLRGQGLNDADQQAADVEMALVEVDDETGLPLTYNVQELKAFFDARPGVQLVRLFQMVTTAYPLLTGIVWDQLTGRSGPEVQTERAAQFNSIVTTLGPFFIKLGQALSIRPDLLAPRAMVELQKLCDKVPAYSSVIAFGTVEKEYTEQFGKPTTKDDIFATITPEPVAAASLGQVYKATLFDPPGREVAVKVQRPQVLETVSLDLYLVRKAASFLSYLQEVGVRDSRRTDFVALLDEFASRIYEELNYVTECKNGLQVEQDMAGLERVVVPKNFAQYCTRRVHVAEWVDGEKLSQSGADDVRELVNVGVVAYLTQLLDKGLFHADPHPGNMLRTPDGRLAILDFGLMTRITDDQRYGMVEAIAHLVHRDYAEIGADFRNLDFIPKDVDTQPIVPALSRVFDAALAGGGAKGINFNELAADLAQITFDYPFRIPPYFALIIRAIGVLEGIALVADPDFAIVDEAYPYISKTLLTNPSDRLRATFRYMVYGKEGVFDADRLIDLLRALEAFRVSEKLPAKKDVSKETPVSSAATTTQVAATTGSNAGFTETPVVGLVQDAVKTETRLRQSQMKERRVGDRPTSWARSTSSEGGGDAAREALTFLLSEDGQFFQEFLVEETVKGIDCLGRRGINELAKQLVAISPLQLIPGVGKALLDSPLGPFGDIFAPPLSVEEERVLENTRKVIVFLAGDLTGDSEKEEQPPAGVFGGLSLERVRTAVASAQRTSRDPVLANGARALAARLSRRLFDVVNVRALRYVAGQIDPEQTNVRAALAGAA